MRERVLPASGPNRRPDRPPGKPHLERLILHYAELTGTAPARVRRAVSVMVLLGALDRVRESDPVFLLKGGIAIELRAGGAARATKDVDLVFFGSPDDLGEDLDRALGEPYGGFSFLREEIESGGGGRFQRLDVKLLFLGRAWGTLKLEIAPPDSPSVDSEGVPAVPIDEFGLVGPRVVRCLSLRYQIAQKLHAVTERFRHRDNERFRDLIDLAICRDLVTDLAEVKEACVDVFEARDTHAWPPELLVPGGWSEPYRALAEETEFPVTEVEEAADQVRKLVAEIDESA
jgi:Nucleotidyl transferase AbiEii toxin, Type IV TA system